MSQKCKLRIRCKEIVRSRMMGILRWTWEGRRNRVVSNINEAWECEKSEVKFSSGKDETVS